ncbi:unnamed protein product [Bursaphelenchus okinawaensis]|uniref:Sin1 middle CRIM domain-containing protein n=1 Tax=Bursaphelenchus okinawaensis TaxID=465554 RepID=A0A811K109_9BILA|nr:unnamed protein product [Bursaphelenchus okinawaensis]CAG9089602.1 unnamed protein product [Bursaphelenchus okinawaensis]
MDDAQILDEIKYKLGIEIDDHSVIRALGLLSHRKKPGGIPYDEEGQFEDEMWMPYNRFEPEVPKKKKRQPAGKRLTKKKSYRKERSKSLGTSSDNRDDNLKKGISDSRLTKNGPKPRFLKNEKRIEYDDDSDLDNFEFNESQQVTFGTRQYYNDILSKFIERDKKLEFDKTKKKKEYKAKEVVTKPKIGQSAMSMAIEAHEEESITRWSKYKAFEDTVNGIVITIYYDFCRDEQDRLLHITISVNNEARILDMVGLALYKYERYNNDPPLPLNLELKHYRLCVADERSYERELPITDRNRKITKIDFPHMALIQDRRETTVQVAQVYFIDYTRIEIAIDDPDLTIESLKNEALERYSKVRPTVNEKLDFRDITYRLELAERPNVALNEEMAALSSGGLTFLCIRNKSSRGNFTLDKVARKKHKRIMEIDMESEEGYEASQSASLSDPGDSRSGTNARDPVELQRFNIERIQKFKHNLSTKLLIRDDAIVLGGGPSKGYYYDRIEVNWDHVAGIDYNHNPTTQPKRTLKLVWLEMSKEMYEDQKLCLNYIRYLKANSLYTVPTTTKKGFKSSTSSISLFNLAKRKPSTILTESQSTDTLKEEVEEKPFPRYIEGFDPKPLIDGYEKMTWKSVSFNAYSSDAFSLVEKVVAILDSDKDRFIRQMYKECGGPEKKKPGAAAESLYHLKHLLQISRSLRPVEEEPGPSSRKHKLLSNISKFIYKKD